MMATVTNVPVAGMIARETLANSICHGCRSGGMSIMSFKRRFCDGPRAFIPGLSSGLNVQTSLLKRQTCYGKILQHRGRLKPGEAMAVTELAPSPVRERYADEEDFLKAGGSELDLVRMQAFKPIEQTPIAEKLKPLVTGEGTLDLVIIGCGPAGLSLAAEAAKQNLSVGLIGPDMPFVNNYGVWVDEFRKLGLESCIEQTWRDTAVYLDKDEAVMVGRAYGRVGRHLLRDNLLERCREVGVRYLNCEVVDIVDVDGEGSTVVCSDDSRFQCKLAIVAAGAAAGKFLAYEERGAGIGVQTAYGIEVEVESHPYDPAVMHFMDYRDNWRGTVATDVEEPEAFRNVPTFLYAMPVTSTRVFLEETCLASRPAMPFGILKARLQKRMAFLGLKVLRVHEEEWSYIPVGGALPVTTQQRLGFGAAASMVHPATGYSIARSLTEAPAYAAAIAAALRASEGRRLLGHRDASLVAATQSWRVLWSQEKKRQRAFMTFGLELILQLDVVAVREFFHSFFRLPERYWKGFLSHQLSSIDLLGFAFLMFVVAPNSMRFRLIKHLFTDPSGAKMFQAYLGLDRPQALQATTAAAAILLSIASGPLAPLDDC